MTRKQIPAILFVLLGVVLTIHYGKNLIQLDTPSSAVETGSPKVESQDKSNNTASAIKADLKDISYSGDLSLKLNGTEISFKREPQIFGDEVYVSLTELSSALGFYAHVADDRYLTLYKSNLFIKMDLESAVASINGKAYTLSSGPFYSENSLFVPLLFLLDAFRYDVTWDKTSGEISLQDDSSTALFDFIDRDNYYKRIELAELGLRFSIPYHWQLLDEKSKTYGFIDDFEYFSVSISDKKLDADDSLADFEESYEKILRQKDPASFQITKINKLTDTPIPSYAIYSDVRDKKLRLKQVSYLFKQGSSGFILNFRYGDFADETTALSMVETIANSLQLSKQSIQERDEYYIEFENFFRNGIHLDSELYANMTASDSIAFNGSTQGGIDGFTVTVSKDSQSMSFYVPVKNRKFNQRIYLPFGLGRHKIYIEEAEAGGLFKTETTLKHFEPLINTDESNILQVSVINISTSEIRYLIPSSRIPSDSTQFIDLAKLLTYKEENNYKRAKALYHWIEKNIGFDNQREKSKLRSPKQVFDSALANEEEMAYFYATLARSIGIPCRVVTGDFDGESHFWNELQINGKWIVADLGEEFNSGDGITAYFNLTRDSHYSDYMNIKVLAY